MADYQYLRHDGFYYRRPRPPQDEWQTLTGMEIWNGQAWTKPLTADVAMQGAHYGIEVPEEIAEQQVAADRAQSAGESE